MDQGIIVLFVALAVLAVLGILAWTAMQAAYRKEIQAWAAQREWHFEEGAEVGPWLELMPGRGRGQVHFQVAGTLDTTSGVRPLTVAHYSWTTEEQDPFQQSAAEGFRTATRSRRHDLTVYLTPAPRPLPDLAVVSRGAGSSIARMIGMSAGTDTGVLRFDSEFRVDTDAGPEIARSLPEPLLAGMLEGHLPQWTCYRGLLVVRRPDRPEPARVEAFLPAFARLVDALGAGEGPWREPAAG